jgi:YggT family protein
MLLGILFDAYSLVVLAAVLLSWVHTSPGNPVVRLVRALTEPVLRLLRRVLPDVGGIDWSPTVLLVALYLLRRLLLG